MKNFLVALAVVLLTMSFLSFDATRAEAATPARDTWVLRWDGTDLYVKAGSLDYTPGHPDAAPEFGFVLAFDGETIPCRFIARGYAVLYVNGEAIGNSQNDIFVDALYSAICNKLIYHR